ncbi:MAG: M1 family metallopeptidase [Longimicrobiales bacterium]
MNRSSITAAIGRRHFALVAFVLAGCSADAPPPQLDPQLAEEPEPVAAGRVPPAGPYAPGFDARHYDIAVTLPDTGSRIVATTGISLARTMPRRDTLRLDFVGLRVTGVTVAPAGGTPTAAAFRQDDGRLYVVLSGSALEADAIRVEVVYDGVPDDGLILRENVHGAPSAFADNWPDRARFWFPSIDHPSDKATVAFEVRAPANWEIIANGSRTDGGTGTEPPADGIWRYEVDVPIPTYTMVVGGTDFAIGEIAGCADGGTSPLRSDACVRVTAWTFPEDSAAGARLFRRGGDMIRHYATLIAPFPYEKLAHVQSATRFGGMENVGAIFYSEESIAEGRLGETTVAHETAHQWFGDAVTEANWSHLWLSEGFATYFGMQYFEEADGVERFRERLDASARGYFESDVTDLPIVDTTAVPGNDLFELLNPNSYNKGGQVLHMLRGLLGDETFFDGIQRYYTSHKQGTALTADLRLALEQASGRDLAWFFDQWVFSPGHPVLTVTWSWDDAAKQVAVTLEQIQKAAWPTFRMPVTLAFDTPAGVERRTGEMAERTTVLRFPLPAAPTAVRVDPDGWLLEEVVTPEG